MYSRQKESNSSSILLEFIENGVQTLKDYAVQGSFKPVVNLAKYALCSTMGNIKVGYIRVACSDHIHEFGDRESDMRVHLKVVSEAFWVRVLLFSDMGFAESYMNGDVICDNLVGLIRIFIANREHLNDLATASSSLFQLFSYIANSRLANTINNAVNNISSHYDISNNMFATFLDETMTYSCAYWKSPSDSLKDAQLNKIRKVIELAKIHSGDHVLEIGSGWGSFAIEAVTRTGCKVTTITLSVEQKVLAEERIEAAGLSSQIQVLLCDYRNLPAYHQYDKIVSIEMVEAVGAEFLPTYFECCHKLLRRKGGIMVLQGITMPESRYESYCKQVDFIRKHIFPGGHSPSLTTLMVAAQKGSENQLIPHQVINIGPHYVRTLRLWRERFLDTFECEITAALKEQSPGMTQRELDVFRRKWEYYFAYCEGGFVSGTLGVHWLVLKRESDPTFTEGVPL
ncbi:uncharacterized protein VTP21DRAFT_4530 [Calcarisporiella thermophila]|uniref:uncharacterized protein n=1 Tax=Calcarisporiella thermophila TaxID=911321 RepID=UPI00374436FF